METDKFKREVIVEPDESGSQGETIDETITTIREAIELYIEVLEKDGQSRHAT